MKRFQFPSHFLMRKHTILASNFRIIPTTLMFFNDVQSRKLSIQPIPEFRSGFRIDGQRKKLIKKKLNAQKIQSIIREMISIKFINPQKSGTYLVPSRRPLRPFRPREFLILCTKFHYMTEKCRLFYFYLVINRYMSKFMQLNSILVSNLLIVVAETFKKIQRKYALFKKVKIKVLIFYFFMAG